MRSLVGDRAHAAIGAYRSERPDLTPTQVGIALSGGVGFRMPPSGWSP
ncbi:unnamed protein product [[Actinomadura] parvosata subsp. kistnae]|nr:unnamed protein product [Actinomadura parvosata subsp. kistnae]